MNGQFLEQIFRSVDAQRQECRKPAGEKAREMLGLSSGETARIRPASLEKYRVFVQSTSANRRLIKSTRFLYEVEDWDKTAS